MLSFFHRKRVGSLMSMPTVAECLQNWLPMIPLIPVHMCHSSQWVVKSIFSPLKP